MHWSSGNNHAIPFSITQVAEYPVGKILQEDPMLLNDAAQDEEVDSGDINVAAELPAKEEATPFPRPRKPVRKPNRNRLAQRLRQQARAKQAGRNRYGECLRCYPVM